MDTPRKPSLSRAGFTEGQHGRIPIFGNKLRAPNQLQHLLRTGSGKSRQKMSRVGEYLSRASQPRKFGHVTCDARDALRTPVHVKDGKHALLDLDFVPVAPHSRYHGHIHFVPVANGLMAITKRRELQLPNKAFERTFEGFIGDRLRFD